jgi:hypothetical protein
MDIIDTRLYIEYDLVDTAAEQAADVFKTNFNIPADSVGNFSSTPRVDIRFTETHSSVGITFKFLNSPPRECSIIWYNSGNVVHQGVFNIDSNNQFIYAPVDNYKRIYIEFTKGSPGNTIRLDSVKYGKSKSWDETNISAGTLVEEIDPISNQLGINTLTFDVIDIDGEFNLGNKDGMHKYIQPMQVIHPYECIRGKNEYLGKYFLDKYSYSEGLIKFSAVNYMGLLDRIQYFKGDVYNGVNAGVIIDSIMNTANITSYTVDSETANTPVYGTLQPMTCRQALREVLFACQSIIKISRSDTIIISKRNDAVTKTITRRVKLNTDASKRDYVSGVEVKYTNLTLKSEPEEFLTGTYSIGDTVIVFDSPHSDISVSSGEILEYGKYYCVLRLPEASEVTFTGYGYDSTTFSTTVSETSPASEQPNIKSFSSSLANITLANRIASAILDYYRLRLELKIQFLASNEDLLDWCVVENPNSYFDDYIAEIESLSIDLVGGFVATATLRGYYNYTFDYYYAGTDIYADDNIII